MMFCVSESAGTFVCDLNLFTKCHLSLPNQSNKTTVKAQNLQIATRSARKISTRGLLSLIQIEKPPGWDFLLIYLFL